MSLAQRLEHIRQQCQAAYRNARQPAAEAPCLIAVSKQQPEAKIREAIDAGQRVFGENRVQEAERKFSPLIERLEGLQLHMIGPLQSNKAKAAVALFERIHSLDRDVLARALAQAMDKLGRRVPCLVQVNTGAEAQKSGVLPEQAETFLRRCLHSYDLPVDGLMCIPPATQPALAHFVGLRSLARDLGLPLVSMGMSGDYAQAIDQGATHVRVGSAIFGQRLQARGR